MFCIVYFKSSVLHHMIYYTQDFRNVNRQLHQIIYHSNNSEGAGYPAPNDNNSVTVTLLFIVAVPLFAMVILLFVIVIFLQLPACDDTDQAPAHAEHKHHKRGAGALPHAKKRFQDRLIAIHAHKGLTYTVYHKAA